MQEMNEVSALLHEKVLKKGTRKGPHPSSQPPCPYNERSSPPCLFDTPVMLCYHTTKERSVQSTLARCGRAMYV